jgi:hypothetical protein
MQFRRSDGMQMWNAVGTKEVEVRPPTPPTHTPPHPPTPPPTHHHPHHQQLTRECTPPPPAPGMGTQAGGCQADPAGLAAGPWYW